MYIVFGSLILETDLVVAGYYSDSVWKIPENDLLNEF